jgi:glucan 1,3-beta-glucosidase
MYYFSQLVGDALELPTIKAMPGFNGIAVLDSDVYIPNGYGSEWYTNQNNFYRQVRNFVIDITLMPMGYGWVCPLQRLANLTAARSGIHWQVAQATSLQNLRFEMVQGGGTNNKQNGIFMENGSGGFMTDLVFNGGNYGYVAISHFTRNCWQN